MRCGGCGSQVTGRVRRGLCRGCYDAALSGDGERLLEPLRGPVGVRIVSRLDTAGPGGCWVWTGTADDQGYGLLRTADGVRRVHRLMWEQVHGPVPEDLVLDHLCHDPADCPGGAGCPHRRCANPAHLVVTDTASNVLRGAGPTAVNAAKTHCDRGHPLSGENLYVHPKRGTRDCLACRRMRRARLVVVG